MKKISCEECRESIRNHGVRFNKAVFRHLAVCDDCLEVFERSTGVAVALKQNDPAADLTPDWRRFEVGVAARLRRSTPVKRLWAAALTVAAVLVLVIAVGPQVHRPNSSGIAVEIDNGRIAAMEADLLALTSYYYNDSSLTAGGVIDLAAEMEHLDAETTMTEETNGSGIFTELVAASLSSNELENMYDELVPELRLEDEIALLSVAERRELVDSVRSAV
ncbi:hypothetical protein JW905_13475 [bacterium]|nr:hypothetical protein [candidate division CSSED10-310 bacterium]